MLLHIKNKILLKLYVFAYNNVYLIQIQAIAYNEGFVAVY